MGRLFQERRAKNLLIRYVKKKQNERTITNVLIHPIIYSGFMCEDKSIGYI